MEEAEVLPERDTVRMLHGRHVWWDDDAAVMGAVWEILPRVDYNLQVGGQVLAGGAELGTVFPSAYDKLALIHFDRGLEIRLRRSSKPIRGVGLGFLERFDRT